MLAEKNVLTPAWRLVDFSHDDLETVCAEQELPCVVKVLRGGSSIGVVIVHEREKLRAALADCAALESTAMLELYIAGREFTCAVLDDTALPTVEIVPQVEFYDYESKYQAGATLEIFPGCSTGAIFWMWVIAFFGMATIYAEAVLAQRTRITEPDGRVLGGPVYYITTAFQGAPGRFLAGFFAVATMLALGFFGCMVQSNSIGATCAGAFGVPSWAVGIVLVIICAAVFLGGVQRLASVTEKIVPVMAGVFLAGSIAVLVMRLPQVPATFALIFKYAFCPSAIIGGGFGHALKTAVSQGAKRGLFSNEAGMGSTPHAHALANVASPHDQGVVAMTGVFIDTFVVLTLNALVIISTLYTPGGILADGVIPEGIGKANLAQTAFGTVFGAEPGAMFVAVCLFFFAFSTILSWNLFGRINAIYLFGRKKVPVYAAAALVFIFLGTITSSDLVWELSDMFNQLMVLPNVLALFALTKLVTGRK